MTPSGVFLRRLAPNLIALKSSSRREVELVDGRRLWVAVGDWVVTQHGKLPALGVIFAKDFPGDYEVVVEGGLMLTPGERTQLEEVVGVGAARAGKELVAATARLASICIGEVKIPFTPGQLAELKHRADKRGRSVEAEVKAVVDRIESELFYGGRTPGGI